MLPSQRNLITDTNGKTVGIVIVTGKQIQVNVAPGYALKMNATYGQVTR